MFRQLFLCFFFIFSRVLSDFHFVFLGVLSWVFFAPFGGNLWWRWVFFCVCFVPHVLVFPVSFRDFVLVNFDSFFYVLSCVFARWLLFVWSNSCFFCLCSVFSTSSLAQVERLCLSSDSSCVALVF